MCLENESVTNKWVWMQLWRCSHLRFTFWIYWKNKENIAASSPYIRQLLENTKLEILQHDEVRNAYKSKEIGLFHLFLRQSMFNTICKWTNEELVKKGKNRIIIEKFVFRFVLFLFVFRLLALFSFDCWQVKEKNNHKYGVLHTKILPITIGRYASYNRISVKRVNIKNWSVNFFMILS